MEGLDDFIEKLHTEYYSTKEVGEEDDEREEEDLSLDYD